MLSKKIICLIFIISLLSACEIVSLDENGKPILPKDENAVLLLENMSPEDIVNKLWDSHIVPDYQSTTLDLSQALAISKSLNGAQKKSVFIKIIGVIKKIDFTSNTGGIEIEAALNNNADNDNPENRLETQIVKLQMSSIIRGNAIRDAASAIRFDDFKNQVQFARLTRVLNKKALENINLEKLKVLEKASEDNKSHGVTAIIAAKITANGLIDLVPVFIELKE